MSGLALTIPRDPLRFRPPCVFRQCGPGGFSPPCTPETPRFGGASLFGLTPLAWSRGGRREILRGQMSQGNVEIVRRGYGAYARGDVAAMLADVDPGMITYREEPDGATFTGRDGLLEAIAEWVEDFDEF